MTKNLVMIFMGFAGLVILTAIVFSLKVSIDPPPAPGPTPTPVPATPTPIPPTPVPGMEYRGVSAIQAVNDTSTGDASGIPNTSPLDGNEIYDWITAALFHIGDRVPGSHNTITLDACIDAGAPSERFLFTQPTSYGPPNSVLFNHGNPNQKMVWSQVTTIYGHGPAPTPIPPTPPATPIPTPTPDYSVYAGTWRYNCQVLGGQTITIEP